jgi:hypothetical protein
MYQLLYIFSENICPSSYIFLEEENIFPKKRELEQKIEKLEAEIEKGNFCCQRCISC